MPRVRSCLGFSNLYEGMNTKDATFSEVKFKEHSAMALEGLRNLTSLRKLACSKQSVEDITLEDKIQQLQDYIDLLFNLAQAKDNIAEYKQGMLPFMRGQPPFSFDWTLPVYSSPMFSHFDQLEYELAMALLLYAAALRQQADSIVTKTCDSPEEEPEHFQHAHKLFQQVAGILLYIVDFILPEKPVDNGTNKLERSLPQLLRAVSKAALGEAQAVFTSRAEAKNMSPKLLAQLHLGASAEFEKAAAELKPNPSQVACQPFRMFLALSSELHQARARIHIAAWQSQEGKPEASCADLLDAKKRLKDACAAAETQTRWIQIFEEEIDVIDQKMQLYDQERVCVAMKPIAKQRSAAPAANSRVNPAQYVPQINKINVFAS